jgi:hypothetical protein
MKRTVACHLTGRRNPENWQTQLGPEFPRAFYHVIARGNRREAIFADDDDRRYFVKAVSEACGMAG